MEVLRHHGYSQPASGEIFQCRDRNPKDSWGGLTTRTALLILIFGLLIFCQHGHADELTLLYSNDMRGVIDPCPT